MLGSGTLAFAWAFACALAVAAQAADMPPLALKAPAAAPHPMTGPGSTWAAILAMRGEARVGPRTAPGRRRSPARSVCFSRSTLSPKREASSRAFKRATTTGSRTASSSAPRSTRRSRPFPIAPASRSAAARRSLRRSLAQKAMARRCCPSAPCEVASATRPEIGSSMRPADWPGPTTGPCSPNWAMVRPIGASCGDSVGRPEPASRSLSLRTGRRRSNICSPTTAAAVSAFQASGSGSTPICSCTSYARG